MTFATKAKEPFKVALAIVIAYGIALSMNWANPYWAGFAVAFVSLATVGQSFNKAAMRMFGTLVGAVVALTLIALFPQERWMFMLSLSVYVGFCTYMMCGTKQQYFWNVSGFVCVLICMSGGADPVNAFETAILRTEETGLGILVYSLVSILLWPTSSRTDFFATADSLTVAQQQLYRSCFALMQGEGDIPQVAKLKGQLLQTQTRFNQLLDAAETDTYDVWELRKQWRCYQGQALKLTEMIERWREGVCEIQSLDLPKLLPGLKAFNLDLEMRFVQIERMLAGQGPEQKPLAIELDLDKTAVSSLSHFDRAALVVARSRLQKIEQLTRAQFETVYDIKGFGVAAPLLRTALAPPLLFLPDPDRMLAVIRVMLTLWLAYLALVYVDSVPGGGGFVTMAAVMGMISASMPQFSITKMCVPVAVSIAFASLVYIFVLPKLSSFLSLGPLLFVVTFAIGYFFAAPQQVMGRLFGLAMFVTIASISNQQSYSFMVVATNVLLWSLVFLLVVVTAHFPITLHPEKSFLRLLGRYFRSCNYLLTGMHRDLQHHETGLSRWRKAFHLREISSLPAKLGPWAKFLDYKVLSGTSPQQVQGIVTSLQELTGRIRELHEEHSSPQTPFLAQELREEVLSWRISAQNAFAQLEIDPVSGDGETFRARLDEIMGRLEARIKETLDRAAEGQVSASDGENLYRLLGAYRGVSESMVRYAGSAGAINWHPWREERF
ncbi:MAG: FUSC family protein [Desulfuromonadales bacterium]|nr:FUSC family protein [Desulfuromonadales bacterium]